MNCVEYELYLNGVFKKGTQDERAFGMSGQPGPGIEPRPWHWGHGVLVTDLTGKSPVKRI